MLVTFLARPVQAGDATAAKLRHCLAQADNASTGGQSACETTARQDYARRMNAAYAELLRKLPGNARGKLQQSQRHWLSFRAAEAASRDALYATRHGTLYVPMQAAAETEVVRDRALQLEADARVLAIDP